MRFLKLIAAVPRAGKTYLTEQIANAYQSSGKGYVLVYNIGMETDFAGYEHVRFLGFEETEKRFFPGKSEARYYRKYPRITHFEYSGRTYEVAYLNRILYGKKLVCERMFDTREENKLFSALYWNASYCLFIIDDARPILQTMYKSSMQLFGRQNHTGKHSSEAAYQGKGMDIILIYHDIDLINKEIYNWATHLILLRCMQEPDGKKIGNRVVYEAILDTYTKLLTAPRYTAYLIDFGKYSGKVTTRIINTQKITKHV
jgi:hypothetical protein